jgi:hypothetical protein
MILLPAQTSNIHIPKGHSATADGIISPREWDDAASTQIAIRPDWKVQVRFKHDDQNLYFAFEDVSHGTERMYPEIFLDPGNLRSAAWEKGQWWFHVSYNLCEGNGEPNVYRKNGVFLCAHQKDGWEANNPPNTNTRTVEARISFSKLALDMHPGVCFGLAVAVTDATGDKLQRWFFWPPSANVNQPRSWKQAVLD